jgi:hypothetical protein
MVVSAIYLMDSKGKILISRNYRGDVTRANAEKCVDRRSQDQISAPRRSPIVCPLAPRRSPPHVL